MQRLNRKMLDRYEIHEHPPTALNAVQFGMSEALLGVADRLIDAAGVDVGIACLRPGPAPAEGGDPAALLAEQDGLYTVLVRGYRNEQPVRREEVVQCLLSASGSDAGLEALAREPGLALGLIDTEADDFEAVIACAARLLALRCGAGLGGLQFICLGDGPDCAENTRDALAALAGDAGLARWLATENAFYPALAEGFALRAEAKEALRLCETMNYADGMIHIAEPFARLTLQAPEAFRVRWPLDRAQGVRFVDELAPLAAKVRRLFDAGLFAMAAPGWLLGCDTLSDCMKHEGLRAFVGAAYNEELIPGEDAQRREAAPFVIECFERFENPLNRNDVLRSAPFLLRRFERGALPLMRDWALEHFEPSRRLSFALAATIMLYAGARPNKKGAYEVIRGTQFHTLTDDPRALKVFSTLSHDMPPEALSYAVLADRELWHGADLREIDGLEQRVALDIARLQRQPGYLPE